MKIKLGYIIISCLLSLGSSAQKYFMCFTSDTNAKLEIMAGFNAKTEKAIFVKYKGQKETIPVFYLTQKVPDQGQATYETTYVEKVKGKQTGTYKFTHSGNWVYLKYVRKKDNRSFSFTINNDLSIKDGGYRKTPCY